MTNLNLYSNSFGWQLFPINFHLNLHKNANNTNFGSFKKTRMGNKRVQLNIRASSHCDWKRQISTACKWSCRKVMFSQESVCQSFCQWEVPMWQLPMMHWDTAPTPSPGYQIWDPLLLSSLPLCYWHLVVIKCWIPVQACSLEDLPHKYWHLVLATKIGMVCKWGICILLEFSLLKNISVLLPSNVNIPPMVTIILIFCHWRCHHQWMLYPLLTSAANVVVVAMWMSFYRWHDLDITEISSHLQSLTGLAWVGGGEGWEQGKWALTHFNAIGP